MIDRRQLRRMRRVANRIDSQLRDQTAVRVGWLATLAERRIDRSSASGQDWLRRHGLAREWTLKFVRFAREERARGGEKGMALSTLFYDIALICFRLRRPVKDSR